MYASTLTSKGQATIPAPVRIALHLEAGDIVEFEVIDHKAIIYKATPFDAPYHRALSNTLSEWNSHNDDDAYKNL